MTDLARCSPTKRAGGKSDLAPRLLPHLARARVYAEPCMGAASVFYALPQGLYERYALNDLDDRLVTFFKVLRDRPHDLARVCAATPYALTEYQRAREHSDDELEEARRSFICQRQSFAGIGRGSRWGRSPGGDPWMPDSVESALVLLHERARRLRGVSIDCQPAVKFIEAWGQSGTILFVDPPYDPGTRVFNYQYTHEMSVEQHRELAAALYAAVARGCKVALSGYLGPLYEELYGGWRRLSFDVAVKSQQEGTRRGTEVLFMSYPAADEVGVFRPAPKAAGCAARALLAQARIARLVK